VGSQFLIWKKKFEGVALCGGRVIRGEDVEEVAALGLFARV
jgi:hypothetical protein